MRKAAGHNGGLRAFLDKRGLLENGTEEQICAARKEYRKIYLTQYKQQQRAQNPEFSVLFSRQGGEFSRITAAARRHKLSIPAFLKAAAFAYLDKTFLIPDKDIIVKLAELLSGCLNEIQQLATGKEKNYWLIEQKYEAIEKRIMELEARVTRLLSAPIDVEDAVRTAISKDAGLRLRLLLLLTSANPSQS